jgi:hypothetical protein
LVRWLHPSRRGEDAAPQDEDRDRFAASQDEFFYPQANSKTPHGEERVFARLRTMPCIAGRTMKATDASYRFVSRQPAASASSTEQNQRVPLLTFILICAYQRLVGW